MVRMSEGHLWCVHTILNRPYKKPQVFVLNLATFRLKNTGKTEKKR